jgi:dUTP pyrophosphatase
MNIYFARTRDVKMPTRGTNGSAGIDFYIPDSFVRPNLLAPGESVLIPSGIKVRMPQDHVLIAFNKSGVAVKKNLQVGACVVDQDYQGEIHIHLTNVGNTEIEIIPGEKILQFVLIPVTFADICESSEAFVLEHQTSRGTGGFGSTNKKDV